MCTSHLTLLRIPIIHRLFQLDHRWRLTSNEDARVIRSHIGCRSIRTIDEQFDSLILRCNVSQAFRKPTPDIDEENELFPLRSMFDCSNFTIPSRISGERVEQDRVDSRDGKRMRLKRKFRHRWHDEVRCLSRGPLKVWWATHSHSNKVVGEQFCGCILQPRAPTETTVQVVANYNSSDPHETIESPEHEGWPDPV